MEPKLIRMIIIAIIEFIVLVLLLCFCSEKNAGVVFVASVLGITLIYIFTLLPKDSTPPPPPLPENNGTDDTPPPIVA